jgi:hypothetical protein
MGLLDWLLGMRTPLLLMSYPIPRIMVNGPEVGMTLEFSKAECLACGRGIIKECKPKLALQRRMTLLM